MMTRSRKYLNAAEGQSCVNCGVNDGTVMAAHYQGMRSHAYGKGRGIKPSAAPVFRLDTFDIYAILIEWVKENHRWL